MDGPPWSAGDQIFKATLRKLSDRLAGNQRQPLFRASPAARSGKNHLDSRAAAGLGIENRAGAETLVTDAVDDIRPSPVPP